MSFFRRKNVKSQVAVVITLIIAVIFLLISAFINIYKVSNIKTITSQASDRAALGLASKFASLSKVYWDALGGKEQACDIDWWTLFKLAIVALATIVASILLFETGLSIPVLLTGIGLFVSMAMMGGITKKFQEMSAYNSMREDTLLQALLSVQSDDVELKNLGGGIFQDPADTTAETYDLSAIAGMKDAPKVGRFLAWYYKKRYPLIDDTVLQRAVNKFINGKEPTLRDGIKKFVYFNPATDWDPALWKIKNLSYVIAGNRSIYVGSYYVTCTSCPSWVHDAAKDEIIAAGINENDELTPDTFFNSKFDAGFGLCGLSIGFGLINRLECDYGGVFKRDPTAIIDTLEYANFKEDMREFLVRIKEVLNMPVSERMRGLTQWFPYFYSAADHKCDTRETCHTDGDFNENNKYDVYQRIVRDKYYLQKWIDGLRNLDNTELRAPGKIPHHQNSYCVQGRGSAAASCYTSLSDCCCHIEYDESGDPYTVCEGKSCSGLADALWWGNYGTCAGNDPYNSHPVCQSGDLYGATPGWCFDYRAATPCIAYSDPCTDGSCTSCTIPAENFGPIIKEYYYQGQWSWRPFTAGNYDSDVGPTELGQAIEILQELYEDLSRFQMIIAELQRTIEDQQLPDIQNKRNEIVYAWKDKKYTKLNMNVPQYSHLARVKIVNYPIELPYISEGESWNVTIPFIGIVGVPFTKCRTLHSYKGGFEVIVSRYDQDQPSAFWNLRRRQKADEEEFNAGSLDLIVDDIQNSPTGQVDPTREYPLWGILNNQAITSSTEVHYGPMREDIYISGIDKYGSGSGGGGAYDAGCASACN